MTSLLLGIIPDIGASPSSDSSGARVKKLVIF